MSQVPNKTEKQSFFIKLTDAVSFGMGTPSNIGAWILMVLVWFALFGFGILNANSNVLPAWFTSNAFNFPLNTITTLAELYIGFLVAAAANRSERSNRLQILSISHIVEKVDKAVEKMNMVLIELNADLVRDEKEQKEILGIEQTTAHVATDLNGLLAENTKLTQEVHTLTTDIHRIIKGSHMNARS